MDYRLLIAKFERWIAVCHQGCIAAYPQRPPVHADDETKEVFVILAGEQQYHSGDNNHDEDQAGIALAPIK